MVQIRLAAIDDCARCAELSRIEELRPAQSDFISEGYFRLFVDDDEMFLVAEDFGTVVGYALGEPIKGNMALLGLLAVDKSVRGKGIGKKLIQAFRERCDEKGLKFIILYAPQSNENTLEFYRRCGFTEGKGHVQFIEDRT